MNITCIKCALSALFLSAFVLTAQAQKIDEKELKVNVDKISNSTEQLKNLEPITFKYDVDKYKHLQLPQGNQYGFLASNVEPEFPEIVYEASKIYSVGKNNSRVAKYQEVNIENLIPILVASIKEQQAEIELLKKEVRALKLKAE